MLRTAEIDMADSVTPDDIDVFLDDTAWAIFSTYHTVLKASPGKPSIADWNKIGNYRQRQTDLSTERENKKHVLTMITKLAIEF